MIVVGGDNLIDLIQTGTDANTVIFAGKRGGSSYNTAMALGRLEAETSFISPLSKDTLGQFLATGLEESNVKLIGPKLDQPTSMAVVTFDNNQPQYQFYRENTAERLVTLDTLRSAMPKNATHFHLASLAITDGADADIWTEFYCEMHKKGVVTTLDPNIRPIMITNRERFLQRLDQLLAHTNILKLSDEDIEWIYPEAAPEEAFETITAKTTAELCVLTIGDKGALGKFKNHTHQVPAHPVKEFKDTVGAGDTFMASLILAAKESDILGSEMDEENQNAFLLGALKKATAAAAINCGKEGCNPPTKSEIENSL